MSVAKRRKKAYNKNNKKPDRNRNTKRPNNKKMDIKLNILLYSLAMVLAAIFLLSRYANTTELQIQVTDKEKEIIELQDKKSKLNLELEEIKDSGWIEEQAKVRMNMRRAKGDQVIYLDVK